MWHMGDGWGWWMLVNWIWFVGLLLLIFWAVRAIMGPGRPEPPPRETRPEADALEILNQRYARGELTDEEHERMRRRILGEDIAARSPTGDTR
jgi:putative membrane protein